jgi:hypothetical protein
MILARSEGVFIAGQSGRWLLLNCWLHDVFFPKYDNIITGIHGFPIGKWSISKWVSG